MPCCPRSVKFVSHATQERTPQARTLLATRLYSWTNSLRMSRSSGSERSAQSPLDEVQVALVVVARLSCPSPAKWPAVAGGRRPEVDGSGSELRSGRPGREDAPGSVDGMSSDVVDAAPISGYKAVEWQTANARAALSRCARYSDGPARDRQENKRLATVSDCSLWSALAAASRLACVNGLYRQCCVLSPERKQNRKWPGVSIHRDTHKAVQWL